MAIISEKSFVNGALKNQNKKTKRPQTSIVNEADFLSRGGEEMDRRRTAFENYKAARAAMQQQAQRQVTQGYERRADAMGTVARGYGQSNMPTVAKKTAYENYTYALKQKELRQKQMSGKPLTPAEQKILNTTVYRDPAQAANAENNKYQNQAVQNVESEEQITKHQFDHTPEMVKQYGSYENYKRGLYDNEYVGVLKEREDELDGQIKELEQQIRTRQAEAETATEEGVRRENERKELIKQGKLEGISDMEARLAQLQQEQMQLQSERAMKRSHMAIDPLDDETKALLREYNAGGMYTRDYSKQNGGSGLSKMEAHADLRAKGYSEDEIKSLAEYEQRLRDYENAMTQAEQSYQFGQEHPYISTAASALMAPAKALGNIESLRGVLPKGLGGYQNADMPTNIYSPLYNASRVSGSIRSGVMEDMGKVGQFLYQAGTSALDSAVNMAASIGLVGAAGLGTGAAAQGAVANTMNFVMGSQVAADSVYEGIQNGKSNVDALIDGIVEGAIEGITEKYSVGDIIETILSGKAAWRKVVRAFASEGAEEIASNWLNRIYDVTAKRGRGEVETAYRAYLAKGMSERDAMAAMVKDFAEEDGLSFLAGGLSGWAMSGTYAALGKGASEANIQWTAAQAIQRGEVQDVIDLGLAQGKGAAFDRAAALQGDLMRGGEPTQKDVAGVLREYVREQQDAAEDAQSGDQTQENQTYQNFKNARQSVEQPQTEQEQAQRQQNQQSQGVDLYDEDGSLLDVGEGWAEIDPEQYAGQQTAQAEAEMDKAAAAADNAYLERQVQKNGYDDLTAAYFVNGNTTDLSVEEYAAKFQKAYERGQMGVSKEWTVGAAVGMNRDVATAAWEAGRKAAQQSGAAQYSISKDYRQKLRQWNLDGKPDGASFELGTTGATLQGLGAAESDIYMNGDKIKTILKEHPEITMQEIERVPEILEDPVLILKSKTGRGDNSRLVLFGSVKAQNGQPMMAVLDLRATEDGFLLDDMQKVNSAYTKKNPASFIQSSEVLYADQKRTIPLLRRTGLTIASQPLLRNGSIGSISYEGKNVNLKGVPFGEVVQAERQGGNNGKNVSAERQERNAGARAGEQARRVEQAAGGRSESASRGRERADQARNLSKTWPEVTNAALLGKGGSENTVRVMPRAEILKNADAKKAEEFFRTAGIKRYQFVVGQLEITADGRTFRADGVTLADGTVLVRLDSEEYSATQLAKHEGYHIIAQRNAEMAQRIRERLVAEGKISKAQIDSYIDAYNAIYGDNTDAYVEEIVADAYAGINRTAYGTNNIRAEVTMEAGQWTKKSGSARAPPELQFSASAEQTENEQTETEAFKDWFGDWQNHPESASKVVNADGTPKVVYHGTNAVFNTFRQKNGVYFFSESRDYAESMAEERGGTRVVETYLNIRNPLYVRMQEGDFTDPTKEARYIRQAKEKGHDGVAFVLNSGNELVDDTFYAVFTPKQIKSATDNVGTFDRNNSDIRFSASAEQISEQDRENLNKVLEMMDAEGDGIFRDAVLLRNPKMLQKLVAERGKTESAAFTRWFGNSKAVNRNGEPLLVFHGAGARFTTFDAGGKPIWLTANIQYAEKYSTANRAAEKLLPSSSIYAGNVDRVIPAYIRVENPANVGDTDGGFDENYMDLAKRIGVRPSELRKAWEEAGRPEMLWQAVNSKQMSELLKRHGYDGIQAIENGVATWAVLEPTQIKSAVANNGVFSLKSADIRYASAQQRFRDALPERAAEYVARTENTLVRRLADNLSVPETAKRETLRPIADEIIYDVLRGGEMDNAKLNRLFEQAWDAGREADTEYYEQYKDVREKIRTQKLFISAKDRADIADFNLFRKQTFGMLRLSSDGLPVDTFYQEMRDMAPELFPASITAPSDQLLQLYEVAQSIRKREMTLNEAFGAQAESFKTWARNDFDESVQRLAEGIRIAKRYQEAQERKKEKLGVPQTAEEAMELAKEVKAEKKKFQKVQSRYLLTDADQKVVNMLLRGDTTPEAVQNRENAEAILKTYEAKADYDLLALRLKAWNNTRKQGLRDQAENALNAAEAEKWVDKSSGLAYMRETMERNIRDIAKKGKVADEKAEAFNNEYFHPVHKNESDRKSYVVGLQDRIKALNLSRKVEKGNLVSESYAVQWLGEAEFNRDYLAEHPRVKQRGGFGYEEWNAAIQKFHEENQRLDYAKIENAVKEFRSIYDQIYQDMNRVRMENGYEPVDYMQGYFPHFQENDKNGSLLTRFGRHLGITNEVMPLPATINGLTQTFRPGIRYMANIQQRLGYATAYDALQGFDRYIEVASDIIYHTGDIQRLRALATQIRYRASDEGVRKQIDRILQDPTLTPDEANERVAQAMKDAPFALSNFVAELDEYTNLLAGKKSRLDRGMEKMLGRKFYNVCKAFESRVGANMVAANIGSALTNFIPLTQAWSQVSSADMLHGMWQTLQNYKTADGLDAASTFIHNRSGYGRLAMSTMDKVSEKAAFLMEAVDGFTTGSVVRARYLQNLRLGMSEVNAMQEADQFAANIMADRSKGATPTIYSARNPIIKLFTQFQLEVNNELSWIFKDMLPQERKKGVAQLAKALFKFLIGAWLYNEVYEAIAGRRAALDPLDILNDSVGDFTGYQLPNTVQSALSGRWEFTKEKPGTYQAIKNLGGNLISELPGTQMLTVLGLDEKLGLEIDGGRIAVSSAIPNIGNIEKALLASNEDMAPKKKVQTVVNELANPAAYLALPFGGGQIKKMAQGAQAVMQGGSYKADNEGRDILQYPIYNDKPGEMAKNMAQALLFGKTATEEAQGWIESGFKNLSAKETAAYQEMTAYEDQRSSFDFVKAIRALDKSTAKKAFLASYTGVSERAKAAYYYNVLASDTQKAEMEPMSEQQRIDYMNEKLQESQDDMIRTNIRDGVQAGTVSEADAVRRMVAGGFAEDENDAYWKICEWKGGDDYAKYDEFLSAVDKSGDVAKAAKTYLDHGVKADALASTITKAYKQQYIAASSAERKRLKKLLLDAYAAIGYDRKEKEKDIDKWLEDDK